MSAAHHKLSNLIAIVDRNMVQIDGKVSEVMEIEPLADKWRAFGWSVHERDGNNIPSLLNAFADIEKKSQNPSVIIANTLMSKGIPEIEGDYRWHGKPPSAEEAERFLRIIDENN